MFSGSHSVRHADQPTDTTGSACHPPINVMSGAFSPGGPITAAPSVARKFGTVPLPVVRGELP
jgi:hypothetical protein